MQKISLILLFTLFVTITSFGSKAQCMMGEVSIQKRCAEATVVIEGKVLDKYSFWDAKHKNIYTCYNIETAKILKGNVPTTVQIVTIGGTVDHITGWISYGMRLTESEYGVFFLKLAKVEYPSGVELAGKGMEVVAAAQGFIQFSNFDETATDIVHVYTDINKQVYQPIQQYTQQSVTIIKDLLPKPPMPNRAVVVSKFIPDTISSGTKSVLTIKGSGFGSKRNNSTIEFKNANNGGQTFLPVDTSAYVSWSDTSLKVIVPEVAGTGTVRVTVNSSAATSVRPLIITYSRFDFPNLKGKGFSNAVFVGQNGTGYTWHCNSTFAANAAAKEAFGRAFNKWRCGTLVNWDIDAVNIVDDYGIAQDNMNLISFDLGNTLPTGIFGTCGFYESDCVDTARYVMELDIILRVTNEWNFSTNPPTSGQYDFESTVLHELGHGHQLAHVINGKDVMNYGHYYGESFRVLNERNLKCGADVMEESVSEVVCGQQLMVAIESGSCMLEVGVDDIANNDDVIVLNNPFSSELNISIDANEATVEVYNLLGQKIYSEDIKANRNSNHAINLSGAANGLYILKVQANGKQYERKIVKD